MTGIVVPRPIAWISTVGAGPAERGDARDEGGADRAGLVNLAPFSAFTMVANDPPMVGINIGLRRGAAKDTGRNIDETGEFVVNIADWALRDRVHESAREFAYDEDETRILGLATVPSDLVAPPRLEQAPISLECRLSRRIEFGRAGAQFTVGEVVRFHVRDGLLRDGKIDTVELDPLLRLGGPNYARLGDVDRLAPLTVSVSTRAERADAN
ncbi:flavin reductase family protein [Schumannella sp. 10F1B-5-1]|nr:flavin reductase family protein [Schumannella sp. 10F1B-5-1]